MADGVGCHEQFEGVKVRQDVAAKEGRPAALPVLFRVGLKRQADGFGGEGERAGGGVEQGDPLISEPISQAKARLEQVMYGADDIAHHRLRGVVNAAPLARCGVVLGQEGLVEVQHWVIALALAVVLLQDGLHIGGV